MSESEKRAERSYHTSGIVNSNVVQGDENITIVRLSSMENDELGAVFTDLYDKIAQTPLTLSDRDEAVKQVDELKRAIADPKAPDVGRMKRVVSWFKEHLPALAGAVVGIVVNPIVGQLVKAGGDLAVREFNEQFGSESAN
ncbi:hypothetical protein OHB24_21420 [Kribbella sp. NBC_00482]|uniref:hypothetical protein n=1 Tax=Kribbella sp. NBC_00482 TaxID=2975968 RepID=UPI002E16B628